MKYAFIQSLSNFFAVRTMCRVLGVSRSSYYAWRKQPISQRQRDNQRLLTKIRCYHQASHETYGSPRIHQDLLSDGENVGRHRVARLMRQHGIQAKRHRRFVITTQSKNTLQPAPNRLQQDFQTSRVNQAWVSDTTFIATAQGWLYLAVLIDLYSRQVIGWSMSERNNAQLVQSALQMALLKRCHVKHVIVHSDQGSTYASRDYQQQLRKHQLICSMSRKGECLDNAVAESFFGTLKTEHVMHQRYRTHDQARSSVFHYIELFYNRVRRHSYLGYRSPVQFEAQSCPL